MMIRRPVVAGRFYSLGKDALEREIEDSYISALGPGRISAEIDAGKGRRVLGAIVPHAGLMFSGPCAAHCYKAIAESAQLRHYDLFVIIGFSHSGYGSSALGTMLADWDIPFGTVEADKEAGKRLVTETSVRIDEDAHLYEHSIEVQLPFLMHALGKIMIIPLSVRHDCDVKKAGKEIREFFEKTGRNVCFIASSDFTHYGESYGYAPFDAAGGSVRESIQGLDFGAIEMIRRLDSKGFLDYVRKTGATICGSMAISLLIEILKPRAENVELLKYYTSSDVIGGGAGGNSVSYAGIVFE